MFAAEHSGISVHRLFFDWEDGFGYGYAICRFAFALRF
jgi:hypothetical protein